MAELLAFDGLELLKELLEHVGVDLNGIGLLLIEALLLQGALQVVVLLQEPQDGHLFRHLHVFILVHFGARLHSAVPVNGRVGGGGALGLVLELLLYQISNVALLHHLLRLLLVNLLVLLLNGSFLRLEDALH